jgi:hypothetical protein
LNSARRLYEILVRSPVSSAVVLGLLGVWAFCSGVFGHLKQSEPWPGGVTLGVMAIIYAAQALTGAPRIEVMCSWRILLTFFGLYMTIKLMTEVEGGVGFAVLKGVGVVVIVYVYSKLWRRSYAESWSSNNGKGVEYSAANPEKVPRNPI